MPQTPDLSDIFGSPATTAPKQTSGPDLSDIFGGPSSITSRQPSETPAPIKHLYQDPNAAWYSRAFDWMQTPLTESLFGLPEEREGASGFERGVEHIASSLTSPLSLALTAATFGTGAPLASAGETALKEAITEGGEAAFNADEIAQIAKGAKIARDTARSLPDVKPVIDEALKAGGHDLGLLQRARNVFGAVSRDAELGEEEFQRSLMDVGLNKAEREALKAGELSPEARDAIAAEKGGFTRAELKDLAQTGDAIKKAQEGFTPVEDAVREAGVDPDLWRRGQDVLDQHGLGVEDLLGGNALERGAFHVIHNIAPEMSLGTTVKMAKTANTLLNTGFTLQQLEGAAAMSPRFFDALKEGDYDKAAEYGTEWAANSVLGVAGASHALHSWGELAEPVLGTKLKPSDETLKVNNLNGVREAEHAVAESQGINVAQEVNKRLGHDKPGILGDSEEVKAQKRSDKALLTFMHELGNDQNKAASYYNVLSEADGREERIEGTGQGAGGRILGAEASDTGVKEGVETSRGDVGRATRPENGMPANLKQLIENNKFSGRSAEYKNLVLDSLKRIAQGDIPDNVKSAYDYMRPEEDRNWELAHQNALIKEYVENHLHRFFEDNPEGRVVVANAKAGKFATNVTSARNRTYDTLMTALLQSPKDMKFDPAAATAGDRVDIIKAAANRKFISNLMSSGLKDSYGRPIAYLSGEGNVVSGPNGEDPKIFVDASRVRKINIADAEVQKMDASGDLQRFLDDGTIKDMTPKVHPDNIKAAIERMENEAMRKEAKYDSEGNNILRQQIAQLKEMQRTGDYSGLKDFNEAIPKKYAWNPQGYIALDHTAMRGWNFVTNSPDGTQVLVNSDILASPEYAEYLKNRLGLEQGALSKSSVGRAVLKAGKAAKETLLSLSPFHLVQLGLRSIMTGVNPFSLHTPDIENGAKIDPLDPNSETKIKAMVRNNLTTGIDYKGQQEFTEGLASGEHNLLRKIPGIGPILADTMQAQTDFIFKRAMPAWKMTAAEKLFDDYRAKYPEWSTEKVARAAAQHANDSFGGVNYRAMGRNATTSDFARALLLAPDWLESEMRSGARLFNRDEGAIGRKQVIGMAAGVYLMARVLNQLTTGNMHPEAPFSLATKSKDGKETLWSIRVLPTDILHMMSSPSDFIKGRLSPGVGLATQLITGRDKMGRKMQPNDLWVNALSQLAPIPVQSLGQAMTDTGPEVSNLGQVWKGVGGTARQYQTPAQKMAVELAANHNEDGPVSMPQQARHRYIQHLEDQVRSGDLPFSELMKLTYSTNQLNEGELRKIQNNFKATQNMPTDIARLYSRSSRLPAAEFLNVWDQANITERKALQPLLVQNQKKYLRKASKDLTPQERQQDPVFQRFLNMIPQ